MAIVFNDTFTGSDGTALTSHTPDTGSSWSVGTSCSSPVISNANRARTSGTGASDYVLANPAGALSSHDYEVAAVVRWLGSGGGGGANVSVVSHGGGGNSGAGAVPTVGYCFKWLADTGQLGWYRNGTDIGGTFPTFVASVADYTLTLSTATSGGNVTVTPYLQRNSDGFYLKPDGTFQAGQITVRGEGAYTDTSPLGYGKGGFAFFEYVGNSVGVQVDTFTITTAGGPALDTGTLSNTSNTPTQTQFTITGPSGGTAPYSSQLKRSPTGAGTYSNVGTAQSGTTPTFTDSTVSAGTTYDYKVTTTDNVSATADSNVVTVAVPNVATQFAFTGPTGGISGVASTNFTLAPNGYVASATVTPSDGGAGGTFTPSSLTWTGSSAAKTFTYTPASAGTKTITPATTAGSPSTFSPTSLSYLSVVKSYVVFVGDSNFALGSTDSLPSLALRYLATARWGGQNRGVSGWTLADMEADVTNWAASAYDAARPHNICVVMGGTNGVLGGAQPPSNLTALLSAIRAAQPGWKIGVSTIPYSAAYASDRSAYNAFILANTAGADFVIDATIDPGLEDTGGTYNDGLHLTDNGRGRHAGYVVGAMLNYVEATADTAPTFGRVIGG